MAPLKTQEQLEVLNAAALKRKPILLIMYATATQPLAILNFN